MSCTKQEGNKVALLGASTMVLLKVFKRGLNFPTHVIFYSCSYLLCRAQSKKATGLVFSLWHDVVGI